MLAHATGVAALHELSNAAPFLDPGAAGLAVSGLTVEAARVMVRRLLRASVVEVLVVGDAALGELVESARLYLATMHPPSERGVWGEDALLAHDAMRMEEGEAQPWTRARGGAGAGWSEVGAGGSVLHRMQRFKYDLATERRGTTVRVEACAAAASCYCSVPHIALTLDVQVRVEAGTAAAYLVVVASSVNRWGFGGADAGGWGDTLHSAPEWQIALPGFHANGALFASRCIGLGLHAAEARLAAALAAHGSHLAALRWYPFEVIPGGIVSVALTPHAAALDAAVRTVDEVLEQVLAQGIEQHELDAARDSLMDSLDALRLESHSYWLGSILEHLQTDLTPKSPAGLRWLIVCELAPRARACLGVWVHLVPRQDEWPQRANRLVSCE